MLVCWIISYRIGNIYANIDFGNFVQRMLSLYGYDYVCLYIPLWLCNKKSNWYLFDSKLILFTSKNKLSYFRLMFVLVFLVNILYTKNIIRDYINFPDLIYIYGSRDFPRIIIEEYFFSNDLIFVLYFILCLLILIYNLQDHVRTENILGSFFFLVNFFCINFILPFKKNDMEHQIDRISDTFQSFN